MDLSTPKSCCFFFFFFILNSGVNRQIKVKVSLKTRSAVTFLPDKSETLLFAEQSEQGASHQDDLSLSTLVNIYFLKNTAVKQLLSILYD